MKMYMLKKKMKERTNKWMKTKDNVIEEFIKKCFIKSKKQINIKMLSNIILYNLQLEQHNQPYRTSSLLDP